jgi:hypothetical protein
MAEILWRSSPALKEAKGPELEVKKCQEYLCSTEAHKGRALVRDRI